MGETDKDDLITIIDGDDPEEEIPTTLPLMPVRDVVIFTDMLLPLFVGRERSVNAIEEAVEKDRFLFLSTQKDLGIENPKPEEIYTIGTIARILRMLKLPDGRVKALVQGVVKAKILKYVRKRSYYRVKIEPILEFPPKKINIETEALMRNVREHSNKILELRGELTSDVGNILEEIDDPGKLADLVASSLKLKVGETQELLELTDPVKRLKKINNFLSREVALSAMQAKIQSNVRDEISKSQRDYFLREQMRAIHKELGESDERAEEIHIIERKSNTPKCQVKQNKRPSVN